MRVIDSDAHVIETEQTWSYLSSKEKEFHPKVVVQEGPNGQPHQFWEIDGSLHSMRVQLAQGQLDQGDHVPTPDAARMLTDIGARVRHMDELGTDVQVLYPTIFILPVTNRPEMELALCRSYNRWMADVWAEARGRLRWVVAPPTLSMDQALEELRFGKDHGACGVFLRGIEPGNHLLSDPYMFPLYEEASSLDLPVCVHTGNSSFELMDLYPGECGFSRFKLVGVGAFHHVVFNQIPDQFPDLRFGFVELSAQWIPYVTADLNRRFERIGKPIKENVLRDNRIWVTCQTNDDLPHILKHVGDTNLVMGTDYGHADTSTEIYALQTFLKDGVVEPASARKILDDNAHALYGV